MQVKKTTEEESQFSPLENFDKNLRKPENFDPLS